MIFNDGKACCGVTCQMKGLLDIKRKVSLSWGGGFFPQAN